MEDEKRGALLERHLDGTLSPEDHAVFDALIATDPDFARAVSEADTVQAAFEDCDPTFAPFFETRVMARVTALASPTLSDIIDLAWRMFPRMALPASALAAVFLALNIGAAGADASFVDSLFGLPDADPQIETLLFEALL
ncbi:MAG: hypothetical protein AAFQ84_05000 [Pseudomonadota bacterium]